jgi:tetratricopeptide (TPR) repeat protein
MKTKTIFAAPVVGALILFAPAVFPVSALADTPREEPVGLVLLPGAGKVLRAGAETPLAAHAGDILFAGDTLRDDGALASFLYCPQKTSQSLEHGEVVLEAKQIKIKSGKLSDSKSVGACFLPTVVRVAVASQQHYGVSMTRGLTKPGDDALPFTALPGNVQAEAAPFENALQANPNDTQSLLEEAAVFDRNKLESNAVATYRKAAQQWPDAVWIRGRIFELEESLATQAAIKAAAISPDAKTYAMVVGISKYQKLPQDLWLQYPGADANAFGKYLADPAGGRVPADQMLVLTDEQATTAALRNSFQTFLKNRPGKKDTVFILLAAHGTIDSRGAYIVTYDSDPQDLSSTALPMAEVQQLVQDELSKVGRVVLLADLCHASTIGNTKPSSIASVVEKLGEAPGEMLGLMASRPKELAYEGTQFGGGHGAFTYSVLKALEGGADADKNNQVTAGELQDFVRTDVPAETGNKQHPREFGNIENGTKLSDVSKPGINITRYKSLYDSRNGGPLQLAQAAGPPPVSAEAQRDIDSFQAAVKAQHLLPADPASPWPLIAKMRAELSPEMMFLQENYLRVALEDRAQQVLLQYLAGDQNPQTKGDFDAGSQYMEAALQLTPESLYLQGRDSFFMGRALLFQKQFSQAADLLERSVRIDPGEAYGYNALGIAYLEQADFTKAIPAFRDAAKRAPNWSYPLHNLALAYIEAGQPEDAIRAYQQAMKVTPNFGYLPYNLGLIYQRLNRRKEAEDAYRRSQSLSPASAEPLNALGTLKAAEGKNAEAEKLYRSALEKNSNLLPARHNLAVLLSSSKDRQAEAIDLWKQNLAAKSDYLPSRIALAELLAQRGDAAAAIEQYREVIAQTPEYLAARVALAGQLAKADQPEAALEQLRAAVKLEDRNPSLWEQIGDAERKLNHAAEARDAYATALKLETENAGRKRLRTKMAF